MTKKARGRREKKREAADHIHSAAIRLLRLLRLRDSAAGVGPARLSALSVLVFAGPKTLGELAAIEQVRPPTMSRVVDALVTDGLVSRKIGEDRRIVVLSATARGRRLLQSARKRRLEELETRLDSLPAGEIDVLLRAAEILRRVTSA